MTAISADPGVSCRLADRLRIALGGDQYDKYIGRSARFRIDDAGAALEVLTPTTFAAEWIRRRFGEAIRTAAGEALDSAAPSVRFSAAPEAFG